MNPLLITWKTLLQIAPLQDTVQPINKLPEGILPPVFLKYQAFFPTNQYISQQIVCPLGIPSCKYE